MHIYSSFAILGASGVILMAFCAFQMIGASLSLILAIGVYALFLLISLLNTRRWFVREYEQKLRLIREKYERKIRRLKNEHDTTTLEKTIRDGTKTLIKNAVDYFKIENIKNEMGASAAIKNLQLDKYGQIIELLADFSLILPDYEENRRIVLQEITHQIEIFQIDERAFADFLKSIMDKYLLTVNKKIREKMNQNALRQMKSCPKCFERIPASAFICKFCSHNLTAESPKPDGPSPHAAENTKKPEILTPSRMEEALKFYTRAIAMNTESGHPYYARGLIFQKIGRNQEAIDDLNKAAKLGHKKARQALNFLTLSQTQEILVNGNSSPSVPLPSREAPPPSR